MSVLPATILMATMCLNLSAKPVLTKTVPVCWDQLDVVAGEYWIKLHKNSITAEQMLDIMKRLGRLSPLGRLEDPIILDDQVQLFFIAYKKADQIVSELHFLVSVEGAEISCVHYLYPEI